MLNRVLRWSIASLLFFMLCMFLKAFKSSSRFLLDQKKKQKKSRLGRYDAKNSPLALISSEPFRVAPFFRSVLYGHSDVFLTLYSPMPFFYRRVIFKYVPACGRQVV